MSRVTDIRYVGYAVPDLDLERAFYRDKWGLREVREQDGMVYFAAEGHDELFVVRLRRDELQRVDIIAFAADSRADVDALFSKVRAARSSSNRARWTASAAATASASSAPTGCRSRSPATSPGARRARCSGGTASPKRSATSSCIRQSTRR
jgi:hypothetical protein